MPRDESIGWSIAKTLQESLILEYTVYRPHRPQIGYDGTVYRPHRPHIGYDGTEIQFTLK